MAPDIAVITSTQPNPAPPLSIHNREHLQKDVATRKGGGKRPEKNIWGLSILALLNLTKLKCSSLQRVGMNQVWDHHQLVLLSKPVARVLHCQGQEKQALNSYSCPVIWSYQLHFSNTASSWCTSEGNLVRIKFKACMLFIKNRSLEKAKNIEQWKWFFFSSPVVHIYYVNAILAQHSLKFPNSKTLSTSLEPTPI